jgi:uncharacterized protein
LRKYEDAWQAIYRALSLGNVHANKELKVLQKLRGESIKQHLTLYSNMNVRKEAREVSRHHYNILSIDGGGTRGIMPAICLAELERYTSQPCSRLFSIMAGTSTGAIIAAGLSTPDESGSYPEFHACDIVQLYRTRAKSIFTLPSRLSAERLPIVGPLFGPIYTDEGRQGLFRQYFKEKCMSQSLVDLVIPAVCERDHGTHTFTPRSSPHEKLADLLMCTTAAPTFFPPYKLDSTFTVYVDGGVQANNPVLLAVDEAHRQDIQDKDILVLSLGTGDHVPDSLRPDGQHHALFWANNSDKVQKLVFDGPHNNIDISMAHRSEMRGYYRWQTWFEKPMSLDTNDPEKHWTHFAKWHESIWNKWKRMTIHID